MSALTAKLLGSVLTSYARWLRNAHCTAPAASRLVPPKNEYQHRASKAVKIAATAAHPSGQLSISQPGATAITKLSTIRRFAAKLCSQNANIQLQRITVRPDQKHLLVQTRLSPAKLLTVRNPHKLNSHIHLQQTLADNQKDKVVY